MVFTHKIVALDSWVEIPTLEFDHELTVIKDGSALTRPEQLKEATIAINSQVPVNDTLLDYMPNLQLFAATGTGIDHIDKEALAARGVTLCKVPAQNTGIVVLRTIEYETCLTSCRRCKRTCIRFGFRIEAPDPAHAPDDSRGQEVGGSARSTSCFWQGTENQLGRNIGKFTPKHNVLQVADWKPNSKSLSICKFDGQREMY